MFGNRWNNQMMGFNGYNMGGCCQEQNLCERNIIEPVLNKCVEREFYHEVPQE